MQHRTYSSPPPWLARFHAPHFLLVLILKLQFREPHGYDVEPDRPTLGRQAATHNPKTSQGHPLLNTEIWTDFLRSFLTLYNNPSIIPQSPEKPLWSGSVAEASAWTQRDVLSSLAGICPQTSRDFVRHCGLNIILE